VENGCGEEGPSFADGGAIEVWPQNFFFFTPRNGKLPNTAGVSLGIEGSIIGPEEANSSSAGPATLREEAPDGPRGETQGILKWAYGGELSSLTRGQIPSRLASGSQYVQSILAMSPPPARPAEDRPDAIGQDKPVVPLKIELKPGFSGDLRLVLPDARATF